jgi:hypothetical protein
MMTNLMTILERKAFISSNPRIVLSSCPPPCGHFSIQESATGGLSYKVKERAAVFYCRPLVTYKDWVFSLILLLYPMILTTKEILKILIINLSSNLTYDILFSHLPSRKHYCHYCNHYIQHHNSIQNQIRNISSIM